MATPHQILNELVSDRQLEVKDLVTIFGSQETTDKVVNGEQSISKLQAELLGDFFHLSPTLFLD